MQPVLFQSQAQRLSTVGQGMTSIRESENYSKGNPFAKRTIRSVIQRLFGNKNLTRAKSDSKLSIDYEHFYITEAPKTKRFSDGHVNPQINFTDDGKLDQRDDMELSVQPTTSHPRDHLSYDDNYIVGSAAKWTLPVTCIDDVDGAVSDFEMY